MKAAVSSQLSTTQRRYKRNFNKNWRWGPTFDIVDYEILDLPKLAAFASGAHHEMANPRYSELLQWAFGPYRVLSAISQTLTIEGDRIPNIVFIGICIHNVLRGFNVHCGASGLLFMHSPVVPTFPRLAYSTVGFKFYSVLINALSPFL